MRVLLVALLSVLFIQAGPLEDLKPGCWYEVPNSHLYDVRPTGYSANVMSPWSGGAYDTKRERLIVWGGGHGDYGGNEIYVFDVATLKWARLNDPSPDPGGEDTDGDRRLADGTPGSRHTYDYLEYIPDPIDRFFVGGGSGVYRDGQNKDFNTYYFDFNTLQWETKMVLGAPASIGATTDYDPVTGCVYQGLGHLYKWDTQTNLWTQEITYSNPGQEVTAALDPKRRKYVLIGQEAGWLFDLNAGSGQALASTGATEIQRPSGPGFVYDSISDKFVAWKGGTDVYTLDMDTRVWTKHAPASINTVVPTQATGCGTYGRFRYIPSRNLFIGVNGVTENVYFYRLTTVVPDTTAPTQPVNLQAAVMGQGPYQANLSWSPATDSQSSVAYYRIYRNDSFLAESRDTVLTDTGLSEQTVYSYQVSAVNFYAEVEGLKSAPAGIMTPDDTTAPVIQTVLSGNDPNRVTVIFSEPVEKADAENIVNFQIDNGIVVSSAALETDGKSVVLTTSAHSQGTTYLVTVENVADITRAANLCHSTRTYQYLSTLKLRWELDETSGAVAYDSSGNGNNGTLVNAPAWTAGRSGGAVSFNGTDQSVSIDAISGLSTGNVPYTIAAWIKVEALPLQPAWILLLGGEQWGAQHWILNTSGTSQFGIWAGVQAHPVLPVGSWTHMTVTYDGASVKSYLNGDSSECLAAADGTNLPKLTAASLRIGNYFTGLMDDVRIYSSALSSGDVSALFSGNMVIRAGKRPVSFSSLTILPNPFNPAVTLTLSGSYATDASIKVFDLSGKLVADLSKAVSQGRVVWNASGLASGVYVVVGQKGALKLTKKIVYSK